MEKLQDKIDMLKRCQWIDNEKRYLYSFAKFDYVAKKGTLIITPTEEDEEVLQTDYWTDRRDNIKFIDGFGAELTFKNHKQVSVNDFIETHVLFEDELQHLITLCNIK